jgi:hypothetical protein
MLLEGFLLFPIQKLEVDVIDMSRRNIVEEKIVVFGNNQRFIVKEQGGGFGREESQRVRN